MGRYEMRRPPPKRQWEIHPIWRGIGFLIILIIPVMAYAGADVLVKYGLERHWPIPYQLVGSPRLPNIIWEVPYLIQILKPITGWTNLYANLIIAFILVLFLAGIISLIYAFMYRIFGPPRYGPTDVPPPKHNPKPYRR
jgi:hypothetical protein